MGYDGVHNSGVGFLVATSPFILKGKPNGKITSGYGGFLSHFLDWKVTTFLPY